MGTGKSTTTAALLAIGSKQNYNVNFVSDDYVKVAKMENDKFVLNISSRNMGVQRANFRFLNKQNLNLNEDQIIDLSYKNRTKSVILSKTLILVDAKTSYHPQIDESAKNVLKLPSISNILKYVEELRIPDYNELRMLKEILQKNKFIVEKLDNLKYINLIRKLS